MCQEQGIMVVSHPNRRDCLRWFAKSVLIIGLWEPAMAWAEKGEELIKRYPWIEPWIKEDGLDRAWLQTLLEALIPNPRVIALMDHQTEAKPYHVYRTLFIDKRKIQEGRRLLQKHRGVLDEIAQRYQVSPSIVVALWGIESDYGKNMGNFNVLRTLFTLATQYPRRADFFRNELREFLLLCKELKLDPRLPKGSYAGAFGQVQMIPSTMRRFAVDFNQNGKKDVVHDVSDSLASIAHFLSGYDWRRDSAFAQVLPPQPRLAELFSNTAKTRRTWHEWRDLGVSWPKNVQEPDLEDSLALIILEEQDGIRYYMTFMNFWVITQWNRSNRFAMTVWEFALELGKLE